MSEASTQTSTLKTVTVTGHSQGPKSTRVEAEGTEFVVGEDASPLEYLLGSLAACINVVGHLVAVDRGMVLRDVDVRVEGDLDPAKYKGETTEPRAGFQSVRVTVAVDADAAADLAAWMDAVAERCPVADNLANPSDLDVTVERA